MCSTWQIVCKEGIMSFRHSMSSKDAVNKSAVRAILRHACHVLKILFSNQNCAAPYCTQNNFFSSMKAIQLNREPAQMNSQMDSCRQTQREIGCFFLDPHLYVRVSASPHLYICTPACIYVCAPRLPLLYLGRVSSSLSSITRGKWNTFVSDFCMVRGGQINEFN